MRDSGFKIKINLNFQSFWIKRSCKIKKEKLDKTSVSENIQVLDLNIVS